MDPMPVRLLFMQLLERVYIMLCMMAMKLMRIDFEILIKIHPYRKY